MSDTTLKQTLHRLIIENRDGTGAIDASDQLAMADEIIELINRTVAQTIKEEHNYMLGMCAATAMFNPQAAQVFTDGIKRRQEKLNLQTSKK